MDSTEIFDPESILDMLNQHYVGVANFAHPISVLATIAVGLPYFVYHRTRRCPPEAEPLIQNRLIRTTQETLHDCELNSLNKTNHLERH